MKLSVVTDELSSDLDTALELACELGFDGVELRGVGEARYPLVSPLAALRVPELVREYGLPVVSISPGLFKIPHPAAPKAELPVDPRALRWDDALTYADERALAEKFTFHFEKLLPKAIECAKEIGCPLLNVFSFDRLGAPPDVPIPQHVVVALRDAAQEASRQGLVLCIENEATTWATTAAAAADLIRQINEPNVGLTWDPANAFCAGDDRPAADAYREIRSSVRHVHVKNALRDPATGVRRFSVDGSIDWVQQIAALAADGYSNFLSIETHQRPKLATTRRYIAMVRSSIR